MLREKRSIAWRSGAFVDHDLDEVAAHRRRTDHAHDVVVAATNSVSKRIDDRVAARRHRAGRRRDGPPAACRDRRAGGAACPIFMATALAPMLSRIWRASALRHHAARRGVEHQRGGVRGREPVVQPVEPEVRDRRHIDQHFRDHHEQDREHQQLARQAEARRARAARSVRLSAGFGPSCAMPCRHQPSSSEPAQKADDAPHPGTRQTRREVADRRAFADLRQGRIGHHDSGDRADVEPLRDARASRWRSARRHARPTMVAPRMQPFVSVMTLMWPRVSRSACARSFS